MKEPNAPSHLYADAQSMPSSPCRTAKITATNPMLPITIGIARSGSSLYFSTRTRILLSMPNAIITTPAVWIAMVSTMSDRPKIQLARFTSSPSIGHTSRRPHPLEHS